MKNRVELKLFERKLEFWNLLKIEVSKIKFKNWNFEKNIWKWEFWKLKLGKLNLKNGVLKIIQNLKFWKLNLKIWELNLKFGILEKFETRSYENWNLEKLFFKKMKVWKVKFEIWNFGN